MLRRGAWVCLAVVLSAGLASGDAGPVIWSGGTLRLMDDHPTISLTSERLVFEPQFRATRVTAILDFHNHGDECTAQMGFPVLEYRHPQTIYISNVYFVSNFTVEVDGEALEVTEHASPIELSGREHKCTWYLFSVPFESGQRRRMCVHYDEQRKYAHRDELSVPYVLATGGAWHGAIGDLQVELRLQDRLNFHDVGLKADKQPLELSVQDDSLFWHTADYDGKPEVLVLNAQFGPKSVQRDGKRQYYGFSRLRWHEEVLFLEAELLCDVLMAHMISSTPEGPQIEKEGEPVELSGREWEIPSGDGGETKVFVDPRPALEAFGGAIEVSIDEAGDALVTITTSPDSADAACNTALYREQETKYRLRCLRALDDRWPDELVGVCEEIMGRDTEKAAVLTWAVAYLADVQPESVDLRAIPTKLELRAANWVVELAETILASQNDRIVRGGAMLLRHADLKAVRDALIYRISKCENWKDGVHRGRNAGLALRLIEAPNAGWTLMQAIRSYHGRQPAEDAMIALAFVGDDSAVEFLVENALDPEARTRDINCVAALALAYMGTPAALEACAKVWTRSDDGEVRGRALRGFEWAIGYEHERSLYRPATLPEWARTLSVAEACRISLPLVEGLQPRATELGKERSVTWLIERIRDMQAPSPGTPAGG